MLLQGKTDHISLLFSQWLSIILRIMIKFLSMHGISSASSEARSSAIQKCSQSSEYIRPFHISLPLIMMLPCLDYAYIPLPLPLKNTHSSLSSSSNPLWNLPWLVSSFLSPPVLYLWPRSLQLCPNILVSLCPFLMVLSILMTICPTICILLEGRN